MHNKRQKLALRPIDAEMKVSGTNQINFREFPGLFEQWKTDKTTAYSIVYLKEDSLKFKKEGLIKSLLTQVNMPGDLKYIYTEKGEFVFVDFGFETKLRLI